MLSPSIQDATAYLPLCSIILMYTGFSLGYGPIVFMLQGEILPSDLRGFGSGLLGVIDNIFLFISVKIIPTMNSAFGMSGIFATYSCCILGVLIVVFFTMPETKVQSPFIIFVIVISGAESGGDRGSLQNWSAEEATCTSTSHVNSLNALKS